MIEMFRLKDFKLGQIKSSLSIVNIFVIEDDKTDQLRLNLTAVLHVRRIKIKRRRDNDI
jgi:uncharacterized protein YfkK (UPF0435 family)